MPKKIGKDENYIKALDNCIRELKSGLTYQEISEKYKVSRQTVYQIVKKLGFSIRSWRARFPTDEQLRIVKVFVNNEENAEKTSQELGISRSCLYEQLRKYHIKMAALEECEEFEDVDLYA